MRDVLVRNLYGVEYPNLKSPELRRWVADITPSPSYWDRNIVAPLKNTGEVIVTATSYDNHRRGNSDVVGRKQDRLMRFLQSYEDPRDRIPLWVHFNDEAYILANMHGHDTEDPRSLHSITITGLADILIVPDNINDERYPGKEQKVQAVLELNPVATVPVLAHIDVNGDSQNSQLRIIRHGQL